MAKTDCMACVHCGTQLTAAQRKAKGKFCSRACRGLSQRAPLTFTCKICGVGFFRRLGGTDRKEGRTPTYCSKKCYGTVVSEKLSGTKRPPSQDVIDSRARKEATKQALKDEKKSARADVAALRVAVQEFMRSIQPCRVCNQDVGIGRYTAYTCSAVCHVGLDVHQGANQSRPTEPGLKEQPSNHSRMWRYLTGMAGCVKYAGIRRQDGY